MPFVSNSINAVTLSLKPMVLPMVFEKSDSSKIFSAVEPFCTPIVFPAKEAWSVYSESFKTTNTIRFVI